MDRLKILLLLFLGLISLNSFAQTAPDKYWVQFTDKTNTPYSLNSPEEFLSQKSIERRQKFNITLDEKDLPVDPSYVQQILALGDSVFLLNTSRWFNAITIFTPDTLLIEQIAMLPFVHETRNVVHYEAPVKEPLLSVEKSYTHTEPFYGPSFAQIAVHNGHLLHELGYHGEGMDIAVLDAGYINLYKLPIFDKLIDSGRILSTWDFVDGDASIEYVHDHGTYVLSTMAGWMPDSLIGTAYGANFHLLRTEDVVSEHVIEEDNWIAAAEYADSAGVYIMNTSLSYAQFDDSLASHTYADMDGNTTRITIAADLAAARGMLLVNSAGNSGSSAWHFIAAPADADSVLTVGAINAERQHVSFSSFGPTADGRVKPDVMAVGLDAVICQHDSTIRTGNGTSFSSPILCGLVACLWQAHPDKSNHEIMAAVRKSSSLYVTPNDSMGYGIPDFWVAHQMLSSNPLLIDETINARVWPNPFSNQLTISLDAAENKNLDLQIFDSLGKLVYELEQYLVSDEHVLIRLDRELSGLSAGLYTLRLSSGGSESTIQLVRY
jgi:serine protease AprX